MSNWVIPLHDTRHYACACMCMHVHARACTNISMHILHTNLHLVPKALTRRACVTTKSFFDLFSSWSCSYISWPYCVMQGWYCKEKLDESPSLDYKKNQKEKWHSKNGRLMKTIFRSTYLCLEFSCPGGRFCPHFTFPDKQIFVFQAVRQSLLYW